jgi:type IV secretory pathway VirB3-like protein
MKRFEVYKNIRKRAVIFGLPISLFALMMVAVIASLLIIIFSFSFVMIIGILIFNATLYVALSKLTHNPQLFQMAKAFPRIISNKKTSGLDYEQD